MSMFTGVATCIAPRCGLPAEPGTPFCRTCAQAPPGKRGGWIAAARRRQRSGVIDASNITPRLWIGARQRPDVDLPDFDVLALCAVEIQPRMAFHGTVLRCPINDSVLESREMAHVMTVAGQVARAVADGKRVLVTCAMGLNRSALVTGLALGRLTRMSSDGVIRLIRSRRSPQALSNPYFEAVLHRFVGGGRRPR